MLIIGYYDNEQKFQHLKTHNETGKLQKMNTDFGHYLKKDKLDVVQLNEDSALCIMEKVMTNRAIRSRRAPLSYTRSWSGLSQA